MMSFLIVQDDVVIKKFICYEFILFFSLYKQYWNFKIFFKEKCALLLFSKSNEIFFNNFTYYLKKSNFVKVKQVETMRYKQTILMKSSNKVLMAFLLKYSKFTECLICMINIFIIFYRCAKNFNKI